MRQVKLLASFFLEEDMEFLRFMKNLRSHYV